MDEWEIICQSKKVPDLPSTMSIKTALDQYLEHKLQLLASSEDEISQKAFYKEKKRQEFHDMVEGIAMYFDHVLASRLLFRQEIPQFESMQRKIRLKCMRKCEIYGCEYLLRLFVRLPSLLEDLLGFANVPKKAMSQSSPPPTTNPHVEESELKKIYAMIGDLVRYLQKNQYLLFKQTYRNPKGDEVMENELFGLPPKMKEKKLKSNARSGSVNENSNEGNTNGKKNSLNTPIAEPSLNKNRKAATGIPSINELFAKRKRKTSGISNTKKTNPVVSRKKKSIKHKMAGRTRKSTK